MCYNNFGKMPAEKSEKSGLSPKRLRFCQEYLVDLNGTQAAIRAGYSPRSANEQAARMLAQDSVARYVQSQMDKRAAKLEIKAQDVLRDLDRIAHADIRKLFADDGTVKPPADWPDDVAMFVASIEVEELFDPPFGKDRTQIGVVKKVRLWPKVESLKLLAQHLKLLGENAGLTEIPDGYEIVIGTRETKQTETVQIIKRHRATSEGNG